MPAPDRYLLGYDIRLDAADYVDANWGDRARAVFLLRSEIDWPVSVDAMIWPSVFRYSHLYPQPRTVPYHGGIAVDPINFHHSVVCLWPELAAMEARFRGHAFGPAPASPSPSSCSARTPR